MKTVFVAALIGATLLYSPLATASEAGQCGYYINRDGDEVPRPCGDWRHDREPPPGATAKCNDGTWSWSRHPSASGTCSHHGGISSPRTQRDGAAVSGPPISAIIELPHAVPMQAPAELQV